MARSLAGKSLSAGNEDEILNADLDAFLGVLGAGEKDHGDLVELVNPGARRHGIVEGFGEWG
jgi:hypothetical protein